VYAYTDWEQSPGLDQSIHQYIVNVLPLRQFYFVWLAAFLDKTESLVEPDCVHIGGKDRQSDLLNQWTGLRPINKCLQQCGPNALAAPCLADGNSEASSMREPARNAILKTETADDLIGRLGHDG